MSEKAHTKPYDHGVKDTMQEAVEQCVAQREITRNNQIIIHWIETHKPGYEN